MIRTHRCAACAAKDQTIALLADVIDWHRSQQGLTAQSATQVVRPAPAFQPIEGPDKLWASDDEEDIEAALESGLISTAAAEAALAAIQAQNTHIQLVR